MKCPKCGEPPVILEKIEQLETVTTRTYRCLCGCVYVTEESLAGSRSEDEATIKWGDDIAGYEANAPEFYRKDLDV